MGLFCVWHRNGGRHVLTAGVLELPVVPSITSLTRKLHISTAKGYISVSAEAGSEGKEETAFFLNMCVAQLAKMALGKKCRQIPFLMGLSQRNC